MEESVGPKQTSDTVEHLVDSVESTQLSVVVEYPSVISDDPEEKHDTPQSPLKHDHSTGTHSSNQPLFHFSNAEDLRNGYRERLRQYCNHYDNYPDESHAVVYRSCTTGDLDQSFIDDKLRTIRHCEGDSDFAMQPIIRLLYQDISSFSPECQDRWRATKFQIKEAFQAFPFWPTEGVRNMDKIVFWSENHLFMTLSAAYLYFQDVSSGSSQWELAHKECKLLRDYLEFHLKFKGVFEVNSHVYLPFTLTALLNLYDFARNFEVKQMAKEMIDLIVHLLMLNTDPHLGVANLTASARAFLRTRLRNHGHNINILVYLILGKAPNSFEGASLLSHLLLTTWKPDMDSICSALRFQGFLHLPLLSPSVESLGSLMPFVRGNIEDVRVAEEYTPFLWSAGLLTHPNFVHKSQAFIGKYRLANNVHLWPMQFLLGDMSSSYQHFTLGHCYTNISLNLYKQPDIGLLMTSFEDFSPGRASFQQLPFMVNFVGIPIWAQSGAGSESIAGFALTNTHNPIIRQHEDVLVLSYNAPKILTSSLVLGSLFSYKVRFFWPSDEFLDNASLVLYGKSYRESMSILNEKYKEKNRNSGSHRSMPDLTYYVRISLRATVPGFFRAAKRRQGAAADTVAQTGETDEVVDILSGRLRRRRQAQNCSMVNEEGAEEQKLFYAWEADLYRQNESHRMWKIAQRGDAYVAILCTKNIAQVERHPSKDAMLNPFRDNPTGMVRILLFVL
jgi:hypothetical protein